MEPDELYTYQDKFDAVWRRVLAENDLSSAPPEPVVKPEHHAEAAEAARLRRFMDDEACDAQLYGLLASKSTGCIRRTLDAISADECRHLKKLRARYFIVTGDTYSPARRVPVRCTVHPRHFASKSTVRQTANRPIFGPPATRQAQSWLRLTGSWRRMRRATPGCCAASSKICFSC